MARKWKLRKKKECKHPKHASFEFAKAAASRAMKLARRKGQIVDLEPFRCKHCGCWNIGKKKWKKKFSFNRRCYFNNQKRAA